MSCGSLDGRAVWGRMDPWVGIGEALGCSSKIITAFLIDNREGVRSPFWTLNPHTAFLNVSFVVNNFLTNEIDQVKEC